MSALATTYWLFQPENPEQKGSERPSHTSPALNQSKWFPRWFPTGSRSGTGDAQVAENSGPKWFRIVVGPPVGGPPPGTGPGNATGRRAATPFCWPRGRHSDQPTRGQRA